MQTLLSEHWHAVRFLKPRLRPGVQPLHRVLRGQPWVLLQDPVTQRFHRVSPQVWRVLALLDGSRSLDEVWAEALAQGEAAASGEATATEAISQHELVQLLSSLHANDLIATQVSPDAGEVFERYQRQRRAKLKQSWLNPMSIKLPLLHPDAWFQRQAGLARAVFTLPVLLLWALLVAPAVGLAWQHWTPLTENLSDRVLSAGNLALLWAVYPAVKAVHEWAHGLAIKAWGGTVREIGLMFIVLTPVPYVDASSSYRFPSKWARAAVAAAGIMAELVLGALALYVWLLAEPGWVRALAFNVVLIAGVSTVLVNGNPLMRYDGYFIACDLLQTPNLAQRSTQFWAWLVDRYGFGAREAPPPQATRGERWLMGLYGIVAPVYRLLITVGLIWFVASEYRLLGAVMALMAAWAALVMPLWKGWQHLRQSPALVQRRDLALRRTLAVLVLLLAGLLLLPVPFYSVHQAVVWLPDEALVRADSAGQVVRALVASGEAVQRGQPLLLLDNPALDSELASAEAAVAQTEAQLRRAEIDEPVQLAALRAELASRMQRLAEARRRVAALRVDAGAAGRWMPAAPTELAGRYVRRGEVAGHVVAGPSRWLRCAVTQEDLDLIRRGHAAGEGEGEGARAGSERPHAVQVRLAQRPRELHQARVTRQVPGGEFDLVSPALGSSGGGEIAVDPAVREGTRSLRRVFDIELQLDEAGAQPVFGDRAWVRFDLGATPLGWQWALRLRQLFLARLNV
jgi:putative peptide zinc metalloprotease protein